MHLRPPAAGPAPEHVRVMEQTVEECGDRRRIPEQLAPIVDGPVRREECGRAFVAAHDEFQQVFRGRMRQLAHAEVIDDQQGHGREVGEVGLARAVERGVGDLLEQRVRLAIDDAIALLDRGTANGLGEMTLARAGRAEEERVFTPLDEVGRGEVVEEGPAARGAGRWTPRPWWPDLAGATPPAALRYGARAPPPL